MQRYISILFLSFILTCIIATKTHAQQTVTLTAVAGDVIQEINGSSYETSATHIGAWSSSGNFYVARTLYWFDPGELPSGAEVTEVTVHYITRNDNYQFRITNVSNGPGNTYEDTWLSIGYASPLHTIDYGSGSIVSSSIKNQLNYLLQNPDYLFLGFLSTTESQAGSDSYLDISLEVTYEIPQATVSLTIQNDLYGQDGGNIGVGVYPDAAVSLQSPVNNYSQAEEGERLNLKAYDNQNVLNKTWFFNDTEYSDNSSVWKKKYSNGTEEILSYSASFTTNTLTAADEGAKITAYLKHVNFTTSGTITENEEWFTPITLTDNVTVSSGTSLKITSGANVQVADNKKITVNGTLDAANATFTASNNRWYGIYFASGSGGMIRDCHLSKCGGSYFIYIRDASPDIRDTLLDQEAGAYYGISVYGSAAAPHLWGNEINVFENGVRFAGYAEGAINFNTINLTNTYGYGVPLRMESDAWVRGDVNGGNTFVDGHTSVDVDDARLDIDGDNFVHTWCNATTNDLEATNYADIDADYNDFPNANPRTYSDWSSYISVRSPGYASCYGFSKPAVQAKTTTSSDSAKANPSANLSTRVQGWTALQESAYTEARTAFLTVLAASAESTFESHSALRGLAHTITATKDPSLLVPLKTIASSPGPLQAHAQQTVVHGYQVLGQPKAALIAAITLADEFPGTRYAFYGQLTAATLHADLGQLREARERFNTLSPQHEHQLADAVILRDILRSAGVDVASLQKIDAPAQTPVAEWNETVTVAPNPYDIGNATQSLQFFHLPTSARIQLYDVAGRHRLTTASQGTSAALTLSAQDYPAGVYLYVVEELDGADGVPTGKRTTGKFVIIQ